MKYELNEVKLSQQVFQYLMEKTKLDSAKEPDLYREYMESEAVQTIVKTMADVSKCSVECYGTVLYLIPHEDNSFLGFTKTQLKKALCKSNPTESDYYLAKFAILVLLLEFYDGSGATSKCRDYIRFGELQNSISERLREGAATVEEEVQKEHGIAYTRMLDAYETLTSEEGSRKKTPKEGFLRNILVFLREQGLIEFIEQDGMIRTEPKLDHFMDYNILNQNNLNTVRELIAGRTSVPDSEEKETEASDE